MGGGQGAVAQAAEAIAPSDSMGVFRDGVKSCRKASWEHGSMGVVLVTALSGARNRTRVFFSRQFCTRCGLRCGLTGWRPKHQRTNPTCRVQTTVLVCTTSSYLVGLHAARCTAALLHTLTHTHTRAHDHHYFIGWQNVSPSSLFSQPPNKPAFMVQLI
jgi:hypothetical protein